MDKKDLRIVFMGTPEFAVESLKVLVENEYNIVGVVTMPDKPSGRGHKVQYSDVKRYAMEKELPLLQPEKLKDDVFLTQLREWNADLQIVVAFRMLPEAVWNMPRLGTFNLHASLLPQYRGAAPINWAIMNGEVQTGATTFFLTHEIDTGQIILQAKIPISENDNAGKIHNELMVKGSQLVRETVDMILDNKIETTEQRQLYTNEAELKTAPKIFKDSCRLSWNQSAEVLHNQIRGLSPYPAAWTNLYSDDKEPLVTKIYSSLVIREDGLGDAGSIDSDGKTYLYVKCGSGDYLSIREIQLAGKKCLRIEDFLRGFKLEAGDYFK